jgi:hypothetical protein
MHTAHFIRHLIRHNPCRVASAVGCLFSLAVQSLAARQWAAEAPDAAAMAGLEFEGALPCTVKGLRALVMPLTAPGTSCKGRLEQGRPSLAAHLNRPPPPGGACEQRGTAAVARPVSAACGPLFAGEEGDVFANKPAAGGGSKQPKAMGMGMDLAASGDVEEDDMFAVGGRQAAGWLAGLTGCCRDQRLITVCQLSCDRAACRSLMQGRMTWRSWRAATTATAQHPPRSKRRRQVGEGLVTAARQQPWVIALVS